MNRLWGNAIGLMGLMLSSAWAGPGVWSGAGPFGGDVYQLIGDPVTPNTLYAGARGHIYKTVNGGDTWSLADSGVLGGIGYLSYSSPNSLIIDADAPNNLYVLNNSGQLYRTTNAALTWEATGYSLPSPDFINSIAEGSVSTTRLYLATKSSGILTSNNSGTSFTAINTGLPAGIAFNRIAVSPLNPNLLLAGTAYSDNGPGTTPSSIYRSINGGASWSGVLTLPVMCTSPCTGEEIATTETTGFSFGTGNTVYAVMGATLYRSTNDGADWTATPQTGLHVDRSAVLMADRNVANRIYFNGAGSGTGLQRSDNGGMTVAATLNVSNGLSPNGVNTALVSGLVLHPTMATLWVSTASAGLYRSTDGGANFTPINTGLKSVSIRSLAIHPNSPYPILAGYGDASGPTAAMYLSTDAGSSWSNANSGLNAATIRAITIDPTTTSSTASTVVYAGGLYPVPESTSKNGGVYKSSDGGATWSTIDTGLPASGSPARSYIGLVRNIVLDPRSCMTPPMSGPCVSGPLQTVYATASGTAGSGVTPVDSFRIIKSTNAGASWTSSDNGLPHEVYDTTLGIVERVIPVPLVINPQNPLELYTGTFNTAYNDGLPATHTLASGVFRSTDGGMNWVQRSVGLPSFADNPNTKLDVLALAMDPHDPATLWASSFDVSSSAPAPGRIYKTTDSGASWVDSSNGLVTTDIRTIYVDGSTTPSTLYAAGGGTIGNPGAVYKSGDGGAHWNSISVGLPIGWATALAVDPSDSNLLYAGTDMGVWSISQLPDADHDGVPDVTEDAGPNGGDCNHDSVPDRLQAGVACMVSGSGSLIARSPASASTASLPSPSGGAIYNSVDVVPQYAGTCAQTVDVQALDAQSIGKDISAAGFAYLYPRDLVRFEIPNCPAANVKVRFYGQNFAAAHWSFRYFGPQTPGDDASIGWYDMTDPGNSIAILDPADTTHQTWILDLKVGQFGSYRPTATGSILFEGGPAYDEGIFKNSYE